jgi:membrane associated rhomboid family serine protease
LENQLFKYNAKVHLVPILAIISIWLVYIFEIKFGYNFNKYGIYPQRLSGLRGILFSPFLHSDTKHLINNSVPLAVMLGSLYYFYQQIANKVLLWGVILSGLLTWSFARPSYHIGASGVVYFLVSFIFFSGIFRKYYRLVAVSLVVVFLYGSMIWYILPIEERISWEGHLSGFLVGFAFALLYKNKGPLPKPFEFTENEEFEKLFDKDGNFTPPEEFEENLNSENKE